MAPARHGPERLHMFDFDMNWFEWGYLAGWAYGKLCVINSILYIANLYAGYCLQYRRRALRPGLG